MSDIEKLISQFCPNGVPFLPIGEFAECVSGATPSSTVADFWEKGTIPWMSSGEVNKELVLETDTFITQAGFDSCSTKMVPAGSVVIALAGQGKTRGMVARIGISLCTNQSLCSIVTNGVVSSDYLYHFLKGQYQNLRALSSGDGGRGGLNLHVIRSFRIPVPPREVQQMIVDFLDKFTELVAELEAELDARKSQYEFYRESLFEEDISSLKPLASVASIWRGRRFVKDDILSEGVPAIHYGEIYTKFGIAATEAYSFLNPILAAKLRFASPGDVVLVSAGETIEDIGKSFTWFGKQDVVIHDACFGIRSETVDPRYMVHFFNTHNFKSQLRKYISSSKISAVSTEKLGKVFIPVPSLERQREVADVLDSFDSLISDIGTGLPAEINARRHQYEYYRSKLLTFKELEVA
jgi:type I restriction enzyme S subunit